MTQRASDSVGRSSATAHTVVLPVTTTRHDIEISLHTIPKALKRELRHMFGFEPNVDIDSILAIPTCQQSRCELVKTGPEADAEKDRLLLSFMDFAQELTSRIHALGYWADYIDPCSGLAVITANSNKVYSEVDGMQTLLNYRVLNAGFCKVLLHPVWGSAVYPASIFTTAPQETVAELLQSYLPIAESQQLIN